MGKGDKKTAKGKRIQGSYGKTRKRSKDKTNTSSLTSNIEVVKVKEPKEEKPKAAVKKTTKKVADEAPKKTTTAVKKATTKKPKED